MVADDGACLWRDLRRARETYRAAITALQAHRLDAAAVRKWLAALRDAGAEFEGAGYANAAARRSWGIVQITGSEACGETGGVVLALDRKAGTWRSIVPPGCAKVLYFRMRDMVVDGDRLYAALCVDCSHWGGYGDFAIDLRTGRKARHRDAGVGRRRRSPDPRLRRGIFRELTRAGPRLSGSLRAGSGG